MGIVLTNIVRRPVKEHTDLEEELHENAHIDYERVAIVSTRKRLFLPSTPANMCCHPGP